MGKLSSADIKSAFDEDEQDVFVVKKTRQKQIPPSQALPQLRMTPQGQAVQIWSRKVEPQAWEQATWFAELPFVHPKGLALMPDVHAGRGIPVGSVLPTLGALVPSAVGVDIGCGMMACRLNLKAHQLPDHLKQLRRELERRLGVNTFGQHHDIPSQAEHHWKSLEAEWAQRREINPFITKARPQEQMGTLGTGNHF